MPSIPRDRSLDGTLALASDPYGFISKRCRKYGTDLFETRIMLRRTICLMGREAAELFYEPQRFIRRGAVPGRIQKTLFGRGGVQGLDDRAHRHRKQLFLSLMTAERIRDLAALTQGYWHTAARRWAAMERVVLYPEMQEILCRAVCAWAGVPLREAEVGRRTRELAALFDQAASIGPRHWQARLARRRANRWAVRLIRQIRTGRLRPSGQSAAQVIARHRDLEDNLLPLSVAAVELLNVLRPTVAVSVFITFIALALQEHPECRQPLAAGEKNYKEWFVQEVRRFYPFFPAVGARVRHDFEWKGYRFPQGRRVMLDLYGTDHDPRLWAEPELFRPERFRHWSEDPFALIPQGGGDHGLNHRCPGEWLAIELMKVGVDFLTRRLTYAVPPQDLRIDRTRLPALPRSRFILRKVRGEKEGLVQADSGGQPGAGK